MSMIIEQNIMVPMRDGVRLATDVYRPAQEGQWPVLVTRHPYNKDFCFPMPGMEPELIYEIHIDLGATSNVFRTGHRILLEVSSSNFPRFDRNSNTGDTIATKHAQDFVTAANHIHHNEAYPSHLILPIIER
jgi:uncharacterized protein